MKPSRLQAALTLHARPTNGDTKQLDDTQLLVLGLLGSSLSPDDLGPSLEAAVDLLRLAHAADGCELFLREPDAEAMWLAAGGADVPAWMNVPAETPHSHHDAPWSKHLAERGMRSWIHERVPGSHGDLGHLFLAWRTADGATENARATLRHAAGMIGTSLRAGLAAVRERIEAVTSGAVDLEARRRAFLEAVARAVGAQSATLITNGVEPEAEAAVDSIGHAPNLCEGSTRGGQFGCPILETGRANILTGPREDWPESCQALSGHATAACCLPLRAAGDLRGGLILDYGDSAPTLLTRDLAPLLQMVRTGAAGLLPTESAPAVPARADAATLELRCFGSFEVHVDGQKLPEEAFSRRKALTVLKTLVLSRGRPLHRDALAERLWPGVDGRSGANRLYGVIHALRSAIEPHAADRRWVYICKQGEFYYFNVESSHWVDLHEFRRLRTGAGRSEREGRVEDSIQQLEAALSLYRGDLYQDEPFADWCTTERSELRRLCLEVVTRLAEQSLAVDDPERSIDALRRGLAIDPLREDFHQGLIQTLAETGRRAEALAQFRDCERALGERDMEPRAATRRLVRLIEERF